MAEPKKAKHAATLEMKVLRNLKDLAGSHLKFFIIAYKTLYGLDGSHKQFLAIAYETLYVSLLGRKAFTVFY